MPDVEGSILLPGLWVVIVASVKLLSDFDSLRGTAGLEAAALRQAGMPAATLEN